MENVDLSRHCVKFGACKTPTGDFLANCPKSNRESTRYIQTSTTVLAENLCWNALANLQRSRTKDSYKDAIGDIDYDLERALTLPNGFEEVDGYKEALIMQIMRGMAEIRNETDIYSGDRLTYFLRLKELQLFMPLFIERIRNRPIDSDLIKHVLKNCAEWLSDFDEKFVHSPQQRDKRDKNNRHSQKTAISHRSELEVMMLFLHDGMLALPTTSRQEASHARAKQNHDLQVLPLLEGMPILEANGPVQVKNSSDDSGYRDVIVIKHYDILRAMRREPVTVRQSWTPPRNHPDHEWPNPYVYDQIMSGTRPDPLGQLLVDEYRADSEFDQERRNTINLAGAYCLSRYAAFFK